MGWMNVSYDATKQPMKIEQFRDDQVYLLAT